MSESIPTPDAGTQQATSTATPGGGNSVAATGEPQASGGDYLARVGAGGDFAKAEVTKHQSRADQLEAQLRKSQEWQGEKLQRFVEQGVNGDQIANYLDLMSRMATDPTMARMMREFNDKGTVSAPQQSPSTTTEEDEDLYLTDEQKEIRELKNELQSLRGELTQNSFASGRDWMNRHFESVAGEMKLSGEARDKAKQAVDQAMGNWERSGDASAKAMISKLMKPDGKDSVRMLVLNSFGTDELRNIFTSQSQQDRQRLGDFATDGPSVSTGQEETLPAFDDTMAALRFARQNPEKIEGKVRY